MAPLKLAIVSTPRSGNTWIRSVLSYALSLDQVAVHHPRDIPSKSSDRLALQIHWYRDPDFQAFLRANGFKVVVIARHPIDVLVSILHFLRREPLTARWLEGDAELPQDLAMHSPTSSAFIDYATSYGAHNLLSVSHQWWQDPDAIKIRYEDFVSEPVSAFTHLIETLKHPTQKVKSAVEANPFSILRDTPNRHGWQATPGLWRKLVLPLDAWRILRRHRHIFSMLGYSVPPYLLTRRQAANNWQRLAL